MKSRRKVLRSLIGVFDPQNLDATVAALHTAQEQDDATTARQEAARRTIADCTARLAKYRAALEAGADPVVVARWLKEVEGERLAAERELRESADNDPLSEAEIRALVDAVRAGVIMLGGATAEQRAAIYSGLGLPRPTTSTRTSSVSMPGPTRALRCVSEGGLEPPRPCGH